MNEVALVTGGSRNIGRAICERLVADGYEVIQFDVVEPEDAKAGSYVRVDLSDEAETAAALDDVRKGRRITRLVNNVGMGHVGSLEEMALADFDRVMRLNARTAVQCSQALVPDMRQAGGGRIVNIASRAIAGIANITAYAASKAALVGMTRTWAMELAAAGITVNAIAPGPIDTDMYRDMNPPGGPVDTRIRESIPVGRLGTTADIANAASFLLDERSGFVTGQVLFVCGGMSIGRSA
ncbi:MAG: SDR family oxidoreductase [Alphaproteobacteria bacterium]|nr:SDR family oxidoreductase [Alphaproteobacteria bacterium]